MKKTKEESEFGTGLVYCLGLFLAHAERDVGLPKEYQEEMDKRMKSIGKEENYSYSTEMWFNASSDHLYELQIPENFPEDLKKRLQSLKSKAIHWGHGFHSDCKKEDKEWAIDEAKELLRLIDEYFKIKTIEATWK